MKSKRGFTLVELLVVITIIGIITILALPGVQKIQNRNRNKKYEAYADTIESAGKLYTDAYSDDMFGMEGRGCAIISYSELKGKSLVKDYEVDGISCADETFVKVEYDGEKYKYTVSLNCKKDNEYVYETVPEIEMCPGGTTGDSEIPVIDITWANPDPDTSTPNNGWSNDKNVTIKISAPSGFIDNISIRYGWTTDPNNPPSEDKMFTYNYRNAYGTLEDSYTFYEDGKDEDGNYRNGVWYLYVMGEDVIDIGGHVAEHRRSGKIKFDNTPPVKPTLVNAKHNLWAGREYADANKYKIDIKSSDAHSEVSFHQYCYPNSNGCDEYSDWTTYDNSGGNIFTTPPFTAQMNENIYLRACDRANNCSEYTAEKIQIDKEDPTCDITLNGTMGPDGFYVTVVEVVLNKYDTGGANFGNYLLATSPTSNPSYDNVSPRKQSTVIDGVTYYGYVEDKGGNRAECKTEHFVVIAEPPKITFSLSGSTSTARCVDGNTGEFIQNFSKNIHSSLVHEVTCSDQYGLTTQSTQRYGRNKHESRECGVSYSCACNCKLGAYACCGNCGCVTSVSYSYYKSGNPTVVTWY